MQKCQHIPCGLICKEKAELKSPLFQGHTTEREVASLIHKAAHFQLAHHRGTPSLAPSGSLIAALIWENWPAFDLDRSRTNSWLKKKPKSSEIHPLALFLLYNCGNKSGRACKFKWSPGGVLAQLHQLRFTFCYNFSPPPPTTTTTWQSGTRPKAHGERCNYAAKGFPWLIPVLRFEQP